METQELHGTIVPEVKLSGTIQTTVRLTGTLFPGGTEEIEYAKEKDIIDIFKGEQS